jgi:hypothetical protein
MANQRTAWNRVDAVGQRQGKLTVISEADPKRSRRYVNVLCDCGVTKAIVLYNFRAGKVNSCGCLMRELGPEWGLARQRHGMTNTPTYKVWSGMLERVRKTSGKDSKNYYLRGIGVDESWLVFEHFYSDMGPKPEGLTLERIDNDKGYCKSNCKWATYFEQNRNKERAGSPKKGVLEMSSGRWQARIYVAPKQINLGTFDSYDLAVAARVEAEKLYWSKDEDKHIRTTA